MPWAEKTTEELVREFKQGQDREENARLLFKRYYSQIHRFFRSKGFPSEDSEELAQDVFFSAYTNLEGLRQEMKFESWLFKITMNVYRNELERRSVKKRAAPEVPLRGNRGHAEELQLPSAPAANPEAVVLEKEQLEKVHQALQELPSQMRRCLLLRVNDELSYKEIALVMGVSINTISAHLHQARKALREKLGRYFDGLDV